MHGRPFSCVTFHELDEKRNTLLSFVSKDYPS